MAKTRSSTPAKTSTKGVLVTPADAEGNATASRPMTAEDRKKLSTVVVDPASLGAPGDAKLEALPKTNPDGQGRVLAGPRLRRREQATGEVPLKVFVRATAEKDDQLAGFTSWAKQNDHTKHTMARWRELFEQFQARPVGMQS